MQRESLCRTCNRSLYVAGDHLYVVCEWIALLPFDKSATNEDWRLGTVFIMTAQRVYIIYRDTDEDTHKVVKRYKRELSEICQSFGSDGQSKVSERIRLLMASTWVVVMWDRTTEDGVYCYELYTSIYFATLNKLRNVIYLLPDGTPVLLKDDLPWCFKQIVMKDNWIEDLKAELRPDPPTRDDSGPSGIIGAFKRLVPAGDANLTSPGGITRHLRTFLTSVHVRNDYYAILTEFVKGSNLKPSVDDGQQSPEEMVEVNPPADAIPPGGDEATTNMEPTGERAAAETAPPPEPPVILGANVIEDPPKDSDNSNAQEMDLKIPNNVDSPIREMRVTINKGYIDEIKRKQLDKLRRLTYVILITHATWYVGLCAYIPVSYFWPGIVPHFTAFLLLLDVLHTSWNIVYYRLCRIPFAYSGYILLLVLEIYLCFLFAFFLFLGLADSLSTLSFDIFTSLNLVCWSLAGVNFLFGKLNQILVTLFLTYKHYALLNTNEALPL